MLYEYDIIVITIAILHIRAKASEIKSLDCRAFTPLTILIFCIGGYANIIAGLDCLG